MFSSAELYLLGVLTPWPPKNQKARCDRALSLPAVRLKHEALANPASKEFSTPGSAAGDFQGSKLPVGDPWEKLLSASQNSPEPQTLAFVRSPPGTLAEILLAEKTCYSFQTAPMPNCKQLIAKIFDYVVLLLKKTRYQH